MRNIDKITLGIKYIAMAVIIGIIVGIVDTIFGRGLLAISDFRTANYKYLIPFLPIAGLFIVWMYSYFSKVSLKGMTLVFEAGQNKRDSIPMTLVPLVMIGTWITHLFGGSAGREGVAVQIGATLSHYMGRKLKTPDNSRIMATFFAMEVIVAGYMDYQALLPAITAAFVAFFTSHSLGLEKFAVELNETINMSDAKTVIIIIILGLAFGIVGRIFSYLLQLLKKIMAEKIVNPYLRIGLVSIPLAIILLLLWQGRYSGLGTNLIFNAFNNGEIFPVDWLLKLLLTVLTLSIGFQGGEVTPLFSIGASLGIILGSFLGISPMLCAALGYAAVFGSATNTLMAPIMLGIEVFGGNNMLAFVVVCSLAYVVNGNRSIYGAQENIDKIISR